MFKTLFALLFALTLALSFNGSAAQANEWKSSYRCSDEITEIAIQTRAGEFRARGTQNGWGQAMDSGWISVSKSKRDGRIVFASNEAWPAFSVEINAANRTMSWFRFSDSQSSWGVSSTDRTLTCKVLR